MGLTASAVGADLIALYDQDQDESREADEPGTGRGTRQRDMPDAAPRFTDVEASAPLSGFDPSDHNVDDVLAYIDGADADEVERVLAAERAGKNRKGIVGDD